jgi:NAD+ synthase
LRDYAEGAAASGYVIGLSGGIDSAVTAALCRQAMGDEVLGVLMPCHSLPVDAELAALAADSLGVRTITADLGPAYDSLIAALPPGMPDMAKANLKPRLRMAVLYSQAQTHNYLVAGTGNKSELMVGYFTKYGDGGVDVEPLGRLYKGQVLELARDLRIPQAILDRPPTAGLWAGQTDESEMGISYADLDCVLEAIEAGTAADLDQEKVARVLAMISSTAHKRMVAPAYEPAG